MDNYNSPNYNSPNYNQQNYNQQNYNMPNPYQTEPPQNNNSVKMVAVIAAVTVVIVAAIIVGLFIFMNSGSKKADDKKDAVTTAATTIAITEEQAEEVTVKLPDLKGLPKDKAADALKKINLKPDFSEVETAGVKEGYVANQVPAKDSAVAPGSTVTLYIAKKPVETTAKPVATAKPEEPTRLAGGAVYLYCIADDFVSLRSGPSTSYTELIRVPTRQSMVYLGEKSGNWYKVTYGGYTGYVSGNYVSFDPYAANNHTPDGSGNSSPKTYSGKYLYCTASDFVSLRTGPGVGYTELARIPHGYSMKYLGEKSGNWYYVSYNGKTGYVSASWVTFDPDAV